MNKTLEQAAEEYADAAHEKGEPGWNTDYNGFIAGAKYQQEKDEDRIRAAYSTLDGTESPDYLAGIIDAVKLAFPEYKGTFDDLPTIK